ncbi:hypothetical protein N8D56_00570 [Devosia sp. A8/3-2]|nr:hypothetical protein N8D56_00570 [Devosia sp. A8/3-2]
MNKQAVIIGVAVVLGLATSSAQAARIHGEAAAALSETDTYALRNSGGGLQG